MPRKRKEVRKICKELERQFPRYVVEIKTAIKQLAPGELRGEKIVAFCATKLRECRERAGLTQEAVGGMMELTHVMVGRYENACHPMIKSIDKTYLEMFSLIYGVSPLYLIGKTDNPMDYRGDMPVQKFLSLNFEATIDFVLNSGDKLNIPVAAMYARNIVQLLYQKGIATSKEDRELMQLFLRICDAKDRQRSVIRDGLLGIPIIRDKTQRLKKSDKFFCDAGTDAYRNAMKHNEGHFAECVWYLSKLGEKDIELLYCLMAIAFATEDEKAFVCVLLVNGGFLNEKNSFVKNARKTKLQSLASVAYICSTGK